MARRPSCRATARARRSCTRPPRMDDLDAFTIHTPGGDIRPRMTGRDTCTVDMGKASLRSQDFPGGLADGRERRRRRTNDTVALGAFRHVSIGQPAMRDPGRVRSRSSSSLDLGAIGPAIESDRALFPEPHERVLGPAKPKKARWISDGGPSRQPESARGSSSSGPGETRRPGTGATGAAVAHLLEGSQGGPTSAVARDGGCSTAASCKVEVGEDLRVNLTGWARPVFPGSPQ